MVFSIVITLHNCAEYLGDAIESAIDQDYPHTEVIVGDDGSLFEDGSKLVGISRWLGFSVQSVLYHAAPDRR